MLRVKSKFIKIEIDFKIHVPFSALQFHMIPAVDLTDYIIYSVKSTASII
jgi:hypothetical protein